MSLRGLIILVAVIVGIVAAARRRNQAERIQMPELDAPDEDDPIAAAVRAGNKIEAIKLYREIHGADLTEAKQAIDALERGGRQPPPPEAGGQIEAALRSGNKIEAIRLYREQHGSGLREAKLAIETLERSLGLGSH